MPHLDYCVTVWGDSSDLNKLAKLQKQAARIILDCHYLTPSKDMFCKLKWLPMKDWVKGALYTIWCGVNRLGDSGVKVVSIDSAILQLLLSRRVIYC